MTLTLVTYAAFSGAAYSYYKLVLAFDPRLKNTPESVFIIGALTWPVIFAIALVTVLKVGTR
tara:strand:+ start:211 stop:396 length:186 start_codon:yes stop_codon:yes gene_type:complete